MLRGPMAEANPFQFSTKYFDQESSLLYYGTRYYRPGLGRWLSKDPIGERGGRNLYAALLNNPLFYIDARGGTPRPVNGDAPENGGNGPDDPSQPEKKKFSKCVKWSYQVHYVGSSLPWDLGSWGILTISLDGKAPARIERQGWLKKDWCMWRAITLRVRAEPVDSFADLNKSADCKLHYIEDGIKKMRYEPMVGFSKGAGEPKWHRTWSEWVSATAADPALAAKKQRRTSCDYHWAPKTKALTLKVHRKIDIMKQSDGPPWEESFPVLTFTLEDKVGKLKLSAQEQ